jgi:hypothetical protein
MKDSIKKLHRAKKVGGRTSSDRVPAWQAQPYTYLSMYLMNLFIL